MVEIHNPNSKMRGILVALEGIDGVGKSTQITMLHKRLDATIFKFPDRQTETGRILDSHLKKEKVLHPKTEHLIQCANRAEKEPNILKCISEGRICICDRFYGSGIVYTSSKDCEDFNFGTQEELTQWAKQGDAHLVKPDLTFYLNLTQTYEKTTNELYETPSFQKKVKANFNVLASEEKWMLVEVDQYWKKESELNDFLMKEIKKKHKEVGDTPIKFND